MSSARWNLWCGLADLCASLLFGILVIEVLADFADLLQVVGSLGGR